MPDLLGCRGRTPLPQFCNVIIKHKAVSAGRDGVEADTLQAFVALGGNVSTRARAQRQCGYAQGGRCKASRWALGDALRGSRVALRLLTHLVPGFHSGPPQPDKSGKVSTEKLRATIKVQRGGWGRLWPLQQAAQPARQANECAHSRRPCPPPSLRCPGV